MHLWKVETSVFGHLVRITRYNPVQYEPQNDRNLRSGRDKFDLLLSHGFCNSLGVFSVRRNKVK